ncbi:hypothetical protein J437_LFUL012721 [Ladona fulva]|uniref:Uncharacterized protein n=1 Tax=Ladona fulva TaxID=123851 RepID=A0A8K0KQU1_LADFU|nr:hypothetical protein J437_LFUL012721 [Ladona fulva]
MSQTLMMMYFVVCSKRLTGAEALKHRWFDAPVTTALSKKKLKRYVIKKRWIKAVNTIIALRRMGARLDRGL